jgi:hypothetical protein
MRLLLGLLLALFACDAAEARFPRGEPSAGQIYYNIVTDGGAQCSGYQQNTLMVAINSGSNQLVVSSNTFSGADVGKRINIPDSGASDGGSGFVPTLATITAVGAFSGTQTVTINTNAVTTVSTSSKLITWGVDDGAAFRAFNTWARANQGASLTVVLTVPAGAVCYFGTSGSIAGTTLLNAWAAGIRRLIVEGSGATITSAGGAGFSLGGQGIIQAGIAAANGASARIQSVSAGATQVTMTAASLAAGYISRFPNGKWIMLGGLDIQNLWNAPYGYPPNLHFFEWRQITAVNAGTGTITLDRPLVNSYLDTWPLYNSGDNFEADSGGPATIYALNDTWSTTVEYRGLTISQDGQTYAGGRFVTYRDVTFTGAHGGIPTQNETWTAINVNAPSENMEFDKLIGQVTIDNMTIEQIKIQSSSVDNLTMTNSTVIGNLTGSPKNMSITDSTIANLSVGAYNYGVTPGQVTCTRCDVGTFGYPGGLNQNGTTSDYSMSGGVIQYPNTSVTGGGPTSRVFVPDTRLFFTASGWLTSGSVGIIGLTQDATNVYVQTDQAGGFPAGPSFVGFLTGPIQHWTCDACTGDGNIVATNIQNGATPAAPLGTFSHRSFAPLANFKNTSPLRALGKFVRLKVNVTQEYTGTGSAILNPTSEFFMNTLKADGTTFNFWPTINLKQPGERIITVGGITCNGSAGACSGDTITAPPEAVWIGSGIDPSMPSTISGGGIKPQFTITFETVHQ